MPILFLIRGSIHIVYTVKLNPRIIENAILNIKLNVRLLACVSYLSKEINKSVCGEGKAEIRDIFVLRHIRTSTSKNQWISSGFQISLYIYIYIYIMPI